MSIEIPQPRTPFNFTEEPEWKLEDRYQYLSCQEATGARKEQITREMSHLLFELMSRQDQDEQIVA